MNVGMYVHIYIFMHVYMHYKIDPGYLEYVINICMVYSYFKCSMFLDTKLVTIIITGIF